MRILYGLWDADRPRAGLAPAARRAAAVGDEFVVAVVDHGGGSPDERLAEDARSTLAEAGLAPEVRTLSGDPAGRLVELAEREEFDRVVLGGGTRSPMGKIEMDAVVQSVLLNSPVTVTVVREP